MSHQPTSGDWYPDFRKGETPASDLWTIRTRRGPKTNAPDTAVASLIPVTEGRMGAKIRQPDQEQANAYLIPASKELARALLALVDSRAMTDKAFHEKRGQDFDHWEYAAEVITKAKGQTDSGTSAGLHNECRKWDR